MGGSCGKRAAAPASTFSEFGCREGLDVLERRNAAAEGLPQTAEHLAETSDVRQATYNEFPEPAQPIEEPICPPCEDASAVMDTEPTCKACAQPCVSLHVCCMCKKEVYCSSSCQKRGWEDHKAICRRQFRRAASETEIVPAQVSVQHVPSATPLPADCHNCGAVCESAFPCGLCKAVTYCSSRCQSVAWKDHKDECNRMKSQAASPSALSVANNELDSSISEDSQQPLERDGVGRVLDETRSEDGSHEVASRFTTDSHGASSGCSQKPDEDVVIERDGINDDCVVEFFKHMHWPYYIHSALPTNDSGCAEEFFRHADWPYYAYC
eukprot:TRINITY_DN6366_c0_g1_i10.p1 TRINITY_DN6366_c0_g1~~TRINITY_DN6366_c0_g1_i10.p1  ORF type:complete len:343 (-),score=46.64 TRINITY_DN6366_c0_g1_i10:86-1060(-)